MEEGPIDARYDLLSQHTRVLPLSFYCMERNGRGTGIENELDRGYMTAAVMAC